MTMSPSLDLEAWLAIRRKEALRIDPESADVCWHYAQILDPYSVRDLPAECECIGRVYFARFPGTDVWVCFYDLPEATRTRLRERMRKGEFDDRDWDAV